MSMREAVEGYYADWSRGDLDGALARCTEDVVAVMGPAFTFTGKADIRKFLEKFGRGMSNVHYDIKNALEQDNIVMLEGEENYTKNDRDVSVPFMAIFFFRDGKICESRDYFDLETVKKQLA